MSNNNQATPVTVMVQEFEKVTVPLSIVGTLPLLCQRNPYRPTGYKTPKFTDEELFENSLYIMSDGRYGFLANAVKSACVSAGRFIPGLAMTTIRGLFFVEAEEDGLIEIVHPNGAKLIPVMDCQMVIKKDGKSIPTVRARFDEWQLNFTIEFTPTFTNIDTITSILAVAGEVIGLGPRRPEKSGQRLYGTFELKA